MKSAAQFQKEYRQRHAERHARMNAALILILDKLDGNEKSLAVELRAIAEAGLK